VWFGSQKADAMVSSVSYFLLAAFSFLPPPIIFEARVFKLRFYKARDVPKEVNHKIINNKGKLKSDRILHSIERMTNYGVFGSPKWGISPEV
jgi:hypothetical protein